MRRKAVVVKKMNISVTEAHQRGLLSTPRKTRVQRITVRYYQLLDWVQSAWSRFRKTEAGEAVVWLAPRLLRWTWIGLKYSMAFFAAFMVIAYGLMIFMVMVCTGNGKAALSSFTKITVVVVGLFAASKLVKKAEVAQAMKAVKAIGK